MNNKKSVISWLGIPQAFGSVLLSLSLILTLTPYLAGTDFGIFKVPDLNANSRKTFQWLGPVFLLGSCLLFVPLIKRSNTKKLAESSKKFSCKCELEDLLDFPQDQAYISVPEKNKWSYKISNCQLFYDEPAEKARLEFDAYITDNDDYESQFKFIASGMYEHDIAHLEYSFTEQNGHNRNWNGFMILQIPESGSIYGSWMTTGILAHKRISVGRIQLQRI